MRQKYSQALIFYRFFQRDWYAFRKDIKKFFINYTLILPTVFALCFGYLFPFVTMNNTTPENITLFLAGYSLWPIFLITFSLNIKLLFDLKGDKFIDYQIIHLSPSLVLIEKIIFSATISWLFLLPFYPLLKLILRNLFATETTSWPLLFLMLGAGSLSCSAFNIFFACFVKRIEKLGNFFMRINYPMIILGGSFTPWYVFNQYSHIFASFTYLNPLIYVSEGLRQTIIGGSQFFSVAFCITGALFFTLLFTLLALRTFKKRVDSI